MQTRLMGNMMENNPFSFLLCVKTAINGNVNFWNGLELGLFIFDLPLIANFYMVILYAQVIFS